MVKIMENPIKMDDLRGFLTIFGNTHTHQRWALFCVLLTSNIYFAFPQKKKTSPPNTHLKTHQQKSVPRQRLGREVEFLKP